MNVARRLSRSAPGKVVSGDDQVSRKTASRVPRGSATYDRCMGGGDQHGLETAGLFLYAHSSSFAVRSGAAEVSSVRFLITTRAGRPDLQFLRSPAWVQSGLSIFDLI